MSDKIGADLESVLNVLRTCSAKLAAREAYPHCMQKVISNTIWRYYCVLKENTPKGHDEP